MDVSFGPAGSPTIRPLRHRRTLVQYRGGGLGCCFPPHFKEKELYFRFLRRNYVLFRKSFFLRPFPCSSQISPMAAIPAFRSQSHFTASMFHNISILPQHFSRKFDCVMTTQLILSTHYICFPQQNDPENIVPPTVMSKKFPFMK